MKSMLAELLDRPKFFNDRNDAICRMTMDFDNTPLVNSGNKLTEELARNYLYSIGDNSFYALKYIVAEFLCLLSSILQIILTNKVRM